MSITLEEAKELVQGQIIYFPTLKNVNGSPMRLKVTSIKTWKRDSNRIKIGIKHGLYAYGYLTNGSYEGGKHFTLKLNEVNLTEE